MNRRQFLLGAAATAAVIGLDPLAKVLVNNALPAQYVTTEMVHYTTSGTVTTALGLWDTDYGRYAKQYTFAAIHVQPGDSIEFVYRLTIQKGGPTDRWVRRIG